MVLNFNIHDNKGYFIQFNHNLSLTIVRDSQNAYDKKQRILTFGYRLRDARIVRSPRQISVTCVFFNVYDFAYSHATHCISRCMHAPARTRRNKP